MEQLFQLSKPSMALRMKEYTRNLLGRFLRLPIKVLRVLLRDRDTLERHEALVRFVGETRALLDRTVRRLDAVAATSSASRSGLEELRSQISHTATYQSQPGTIQQAIHSTIKENRDPSAMSALYEAFEARFRPANDERFNEELNQAYGETIERLGSSQTNRSCIDIGCGRGEWVRFLAQRGWNAIGVDDNASMLARTKINAISGTQFICEDGIKFLKNTKPESVALISALHVVEHMPLEAVLELINAAYLALAPHGILILETPNPENLIVGACNFYTDPTHLRPIPPHTLDFFVAQRGFAETQIIRKGKSPGPEPTKDATINFVLQSLTAAPDYAVVGFKGPTL